MMEWFRKWRERMMVQPYMGTVEDAEQAVLASERDALAAERGDTESPRARLERVRELLFPTPSVETLSEGTVVAVDHSVDYNLDAALDDLVEGHNDDVPQRTIRRAVAVLSEVRLLVGAEQELPEEVRRIFFAGIKGGPDDEVS